MNPFFIKTDLGRGERPDWCLDGDCQIRSLAHATGMTYAKAWDTLYQILGEYRTPGFALPDYLDHCPERLGVEERLSFPAKRGQPRMTPIDFCRRYPRGRYILKLAHHVVAVVDGRYYDKWNCGDKCVYTAWRICQA